MKHDLDAETLRSPPPAESQVGRLRRRARSYLGQGVGSTLAGTLGALSEALGRETREDATLGKRRLEEVLERDRAQRGARVSEPAAPSPAREKPAAKAATSSARERDEELFGVEPIRTRTMARLLAEQGYAKRALAIYDELLQRSPEDASLREAIAKLRGPRSA